MGRGVLWYGAWLILLPLAGWSIGSSHPLSILLIGPILFFAFWNAVQFCVCPGCQKRIGRITAKISHCPFCGCEAWIQVQGDHGKGSVE